MLEKCGLLFRGNQGSVIQHRKTQNKSINNLRSIGVYFTFWEEISERIEIEPYCKSFASDPNSKMTAAELSGTYWAIYLIWERVNLLMRELWGLQLC